MSKGLRRIAIAVLVSLGIAAGAQISPAQATNGPAANGQQEQKRMTNSDVIRMVQERRSESEIIREIRAAFQSGGAAFDVSPTALVELHKAGVGTNILNAMMGDGSVRPAGTVPGRGAYTGNTVPGVANANGAHPQPFPPKGKEAGATSRMAKLGTVESGPTAKNSNSRQIMGNSGSNEIIAVLEKEKSGAQMEAAAMTHTSLLRPGIQVPSVPAHTTAASGSTPLGATGAGAPATAANPNAGPTKHLPPAGPQPTNPMALEPSNTHANIALVCAQEEKMRILTVSGLSGPATFTPDPNYNFYTITGCTFGAIGTNAKVYIYNQGKFHADFQIQEWNENGIKLNLDPSITGQLDQGNVTLVVQANNGLQAVRANCKFFAARETRMLRDIPKPDFSLNRFTPTDTSNLQLNYTSPSSPDVVPNIGGYTAEVSWYDPKADYNQAHPGFSVWMKGGEDIYRLDALQPGFVVDSVALGYRNLQCPSGTLHTEGNFNPSINGSQVHVQWQGQTCTVSGCGGFGQPDCFIERASTNYAINVAITGPRGVDPWTGKPTASK